MSAWTSPEPALPSTVVSASGFDASTRRIIAACSARGATSSQTARTLASMLQDFFAGVSAYSP